MREKVKIKKILVGLGWIFLACILVSICIGAGMATFCIISETPKNSESASLQIRNIILYIASIIILGFISFAATIQIKEILDSRSNDKLMRRANQIAIII